MRDPDRIETILGLIGKYWFRHPDLRLAQIVVNLTGKQAPEVFYTEDDVLLQGLREWWLKHESGADDDDDAIPTADKPNQWWMNLTDDQRMDWLAAHECCRHCGSLDTRCQCMNDE